MSSSGEEEELKNDPEARIAFRRMRIHKRIEAATRYNCVIFIYFRDIPIFE